jgi:hypothetical protein
MNLLPASFAALRSGQRVIIESQGPQAIRVRIFPHNPYPYVGRARRLPPVAFPFGSRRVSNTATPRTFTAAGPVSAAQGTKTTPANHRIRNVSAAGATHVKSRMR